MTFLRVFECFMLFYFSVVYSKFVYSNCFVYIHIYTYIYIFPIQKVTFNEIPVEGLLLAKMSRTFISVYQFRGPFSVRCRCLCYKRIEMLLPHTHICICIPFFFVVFLCWCCCFYFPTWHDFWPSDCLYLCFPPFSMANLSRKETEKHVPYRLCFN